MVAIFTLTVRAADSDTEQVDRFLSRLGLVDLQILHLERSLDEPLDDGAKMAAARRLADLYAGRLMETADQPQRYRQLLAGIKRLTERFPQANTTALNVMLLQADYNRAESRVGQWLADRQQTQALAEAKEILDRIEPQLQSYQDELNQEVEALYKQIDELPEGDQRDELEKQAARTQGLAGRATYFAGWSSYYMGATRENPIEAADDFQRARDVFQKVLGLTGEDKDYGKVETAWLGLELPTRARCVIGLGLAEAAAGNLTGSQQVFSWLESSAVAPQIRDQAANWYVQGLINAGHFTVAENYAASRVEKFTGAATQGKISLCVTLIRTGYAEGASEGARRLGQLGVAGLTRLRQFGVLKTLIERHGIDLSQRSDFYSLWLRGQQQFDDAEKTKAKADYEAADELLTKALSAKQAPSDVASAAQCRYYRGWTRYRLENFAAAARDFEQAITGLKTADAETAAQSAWLAHACYRKLIGTSPTAAGAAIGVLELIKREFPNSSFAQRADYQIAKLRDAAATPEESIAALKRIKPGEENYLSARYDLCVLLHRQWQTASAANSGGSQAKKVYGELKSAVDVYRQAAGNQEPERQLPSVLKVVDAALGSKPADRQTAESHLRLAAALAARVDAGDPSQAEYHYRQLQMARLKGDDAARREHAGWIVENAHGSRYELPALVNVATALDAQIKTSSSEKRSALQSEAYDVYSRLSRRLGDATDVLKRSKNARVALLKRADYADQLGRHDEAAAAMEKLLAAYPKDRDYLRRTALALFHAGRYGDSLAHWQTLLRGVPPGEDDWYEAKYHQIACLTHTDKNGAAKVFKQFQLLYPEQGGDAWRAKFQTLQRNLP